MMKDFFPVLSELGFSARTIAEFLEMLEKSRDMMAYTFKILGKGKKGKRSDKKIYDRDKKINVTERLIRREILVHLSAATGDNIAICLRLMSVIKDAERMGDYVKNLFELRYYSRDTENDTYLFGKLFDQHGNDLLALFDMVSTSFRESDATLAMKSADAGKSLARSFDEFIISLAKSETPAREAAILTLGAYYMKRISEHLFNISSSVFTPISDV